MDYYAPLKGVLSPLLCRLKYLMGCGLSYCRLYLPHGLSLIVFIFQNVAGEDFIFLMRFYHFLPVFVEEKLLTKFLR